MDFRKIQPSDFKAVLDLLDAAFPVPREWIEKDLMEIQQNPQANGEIHGLYVDDTLIGTILYGSIYGKVSSCRSEDEHWMGQGLIRYTAVQPAHRRKGYATWMVKKAIQDLKEIGSPCVATALWVSQENEIGKHLFESLDFTIYNDTFTDEFGFTHQSYALWF